MNINSITCRKSKRILVLSTVVCPVFFGAVGCAGSDRWENPSINRSFWAADQSTRRCDSERRASSEQERELGRLHAIGAQEGISNYWQSMIRYYSEGYTSQLFEECLRARGYPKVRRDD